MNPLTPLEAATRADEGHAVASGLGLDEVAALLRSMARGSSGSEEALDARRYRRLRLLGCAPSYTKHLETQSVLRFSNLDEFVDGDLKAIPSRGEAIPGHAQGSGDCGEMVAQIEELSRRVTAHEQLQARIVQALGRETWQGDLAAAVEADVARANANAESCKQFSDRLRDIVTALDHGLSQRAREAAELALRMPWLSGSSVPSTTSKTAEG